MSSLWSAVTSPHTPKERAEDLARPEKQPDWIARRRRVARTVDYLYVEQIVASGSAVYEVQVHACRNGKGTQDVVDINLVLDVRLCVCLVGRFGPAKPDLSATIIANKMQVARRRRRHNVTAGFTRGVDRIACRHVASRPVPHANAERVPCRGGQMANDYSEIFGRPCYPIDMLGDPVTVYVNAVRATMVSDIVHGLRPAQLHLRGSEDGSFKNRRLRRSRISQSAGVHDITIAGSVARSVNRIDRERVGTLSRQELRRISGF